MKKINKALINKNSILLWQGVGVSLFGDIIYDIAIAKTVYDMTNSTLLVSLVIILNLLPTIILMPISGVLVERLSKKSVLVYTDLIRGLLIIFLGLCFLIEFNYVLVCIISFSLGVCESFFRPSIISLVPQIIEEKLLLKAASITTVISSTVHILANFFSGTILLVFNIPVIIIINGITFIVSAISECFINAHENRSTNDKVLYSFKQIKSDFAESKTFFVKNKSYSALLITYCIMVFLISVYTILRFPFFETYFNIELYGISVAFMSAGGIIASTLLSISNVGRDNYRILLGSALGMSIPMLFIGTQHSLIIIAIMLCYGFFNSIFNTVFNVLLVTGIPQEITARVTSITTPLILISALVGQLIGGILGDIANISTIIKGVFILVLFISIINAINLTKLLKT